MIRLREIPPRHILTGVLAVSVALALVAAPQVEPPLVWGLAALLMVVAGVGVTLLVPAPVYDDIPVVGLLPTLVVLVSLVLISQPWFSDESFIIGLAVLVALVLAGIVFTWRLPPEHRYYRWGRSAMVLLAYLLAFAMYTSIYMTKVRSVFTATAVALMTILVAFELFYSPRYNLWRVGLYTVTCALIVGQITWVLNYWVIGGLTGGAFLLLVLYAITGVVRAYLAGRMTVRLAVEYAAVLGVGFVAVAALVSSQSTI